MRRRDEATLWLPGFDWSGAAPAPEPADANERRHALDPETSFIVQAPAGSGKTELLIQRYLVLLARVLQPESIVAITFTVKAAGEMRARVLEALAKAAAHTEPESAHERLTLELASAALAQDTRQGWSLLRNPDRLRIQTIDALSMTITRQMPWLARFGAMPEVVEDARMYYQQAAARAVQELGRESSGDAVECLLEHLDNDAARTVDLLGSMLATRDHWLRVIGGHTDPAEVRSVLEAALRRMVSSHLDRLRAAVPGGRQGELLELARYAGANVHASDPVIARCANLWTLPEALDEWIGIAKLLLTGKGEWRKSPDRRVGFPTHNKPMKQRMESLLREFDAALEFRDLLARVAELPAPAYQEEQWRVLSALFALLPRTVAHLRTVFTEAGRVDFVEIASAASRALGTPDDPTDLALAMGTRIEHLLVDEFQDTSITQFELLLKLTPGWQDDARTIFLVGDPMQSIYRFRQAEVGLFLNVRQSGIGALHPEPLGLSVNFRSARSVVEWVNDLFRGVFPAEADAYTGAIPYTASIASSEGDEGAGVTVHPFLGRNDRAEADLVIDLVERARREMPGSRTAVLVRSRAHLAAIADRLREARIRYRAIEIQALAEKPVIQDLLALTRALLHLGDRVAWLSVLRAPWCGLTLAALHHIAAGDRSTPVWSLLQDLPPNVDEDSAARVAGVVPVLSRALEKRGRVPVAELTERTWIALGGDHIVDGNDLADARAYFDLLEEMGAQGDVEDLELLAARVGELFANPDSDAGNALELMTIHRAKGLEFDTVILPGLGKRPRVDDTPLLVWSERAEGERTDLLMAPLAGRGDGDKRIYDCIRRENDVKNRHESERLLYVACTRARTALHLIAHAEVKIEINGAVLCDPHRDSLLAHVWSAVRPLFEELLPEAILAAQPEQTSPRIPRPLRRVVSVMGAGVAPAAAISEPSRMQLEHDASDPARQVGTVTHRLLDRIARDGVNAWSADRIHRLGPVLRTLLAGEGVPASLMDAACERVAAGLTRALSDPRGRWVLGHHAEARSELAVSGMIDGEVRHMAIDRTFIDDDGVRWIVDYKTGEADSIEAARREYQAQLAGYATLLERMEGCGFRVGLYFPMTGEWVEWDPFGED